MDPKIISIALEQAGVPLTEHKCALLARHAELVLGANQTLNLTRITEPDAVVRLHIVDSLVFLPHLDGLQAPILDLGSGAGYPGIPLAIALGVPVTLCESVGKKGRFLERAVKELGIQATVYQGRAEELARSAPASFETVLARAVAALPALVELAAPLLLQSGLLVALKGDLDSDELERGDKAGGLCGLAREHEVRYFLPEGDETRTLVTYRRLREPTVALPRRAGLAQRRPLA